MTATQWPTRPQRLIDEIRLLCVNWLHAPLRQCLDDFDRRLFALADQSANHLEQQRLLVTRQRLTQECQLFNQHFIASVVDAFARLGVAPAAPAAAVLGTLSLLDPMEHELTSALDQLAARSEARAGSALTELSFRLAVLVGTPPLEGETLPFGPHALTCAFRDASGALHLHGEDELLLLQSVENHLMQALTPLYDLTNAHLLADGILPCLRAFALPRAPARLPEPGADSKLDERVDTVASEAGRNAPIAVLDSLRELLARQRAPQVEPAKSDADTTPRIATADELQIALEALQQHVTDVSDHVSRELRSAQRLREELVTQLNAVRPAGAAPTDLSVEQNDTVELVAMLFEQMGKQVHTGGAAHSLLGGLQVPLLRVAMSDRQFFEQREHPARQLLDKVTAAADEWLDNAGGEADRTLRAKLRKLVERAGQQPLGSERSTALLEDIEQHLAQLRNKAQLAERRHVEAMQGRERLVQARQRAAELMAERFAKSPPHGLLRTLLDRAWSDVLALTLLRHGEQSDTFAMRLAITDQLLGLLPVGNREQLQIEVQIGLQQIGMQGEEATQVAARLLGAGAPPIAGAETPSVTSLAMRLKQHHRLGEKTADAPVMPDASAELIKHPPSRQEIQIRERLRSLPFGTWFEFVDPINQAVTARKLAWFSSVSGRALFVNRRGQRAEEMSLRQLTDAISAGDVREQAVAAESILDRAWRALSGNLRQSSHSAGASR